MTTTAYRIIDCLGDLHAMDHLSLTSPKTAAIDLVSGAIYEAHPDWPEGERLSVELSSGKSSPSQRTKLSSTSLYVMLKPWQLLKIQLCVCNTIILPITSASRPGSVIRAARSAFVESRVTAPGKSAWYRRALQAITANEFNNEPPTMPRDDQIARFASPSRNDSARNAPNGERPR
ncbi:hypothetical protein [Candidatus Burkholderia verschuerenii]|uniref:hypothetical protein n=1 Tax=Candidatus Burkholderia verschuerenii TaxID=242163 RepID=UPI0012EE3867|nr:hypothetical protein [Candidatus Burkholderia verschuerenii]